MTQRPLLQPIIAAPLSLLLVSGCAQGMMGASPSTIMNAVILAGAAIGTRTSSSGRGSTKRVPTNSPPPTMMADRVLRTADQFLGTPYTWGGSTPQSGFDCSGFTQYVFGRQGIHLPRTSREQAHAGGGLAADPAALIPGDIMLFAEPGEAISHVAIYVGGGEIIHSSSSGRGVRYDDLNSSRGAWYVQNMVAARRLTTSGRSLVQSLETLAIPGLPFDAPDRAPAPR